MAADLHREPDVGGIREEDTARDPGGDPEAGSGALIRLAGLLAFLVFAGSLAMAQADSHASAADIEIFTRAGCPHCEKAQVFLAELVRERPDLIVVVSLVDEDPAILLRLRELYERHGIVAGGVPTFLVRGKVQVGFLDAETSGREIRALLADDEATPETRTFGELSVSRLGLPLFTVAVGLLDGFNPCAMWVLLFLLSLLVHIGSRRRMAAVAGTFVLVSGLAYYAFLAAWLGMFLLIGILRPVQVGLGLLAGAAGAMHLKEALAPGVGPALAIPDSAKPGLYARMRAIVRAENLPAALAGVIVLALLVNVVELLCTAGLPALFTQVLSLQELSWPVYHGYLALYIIAYMADDALMVSIAIVTLGHRKLGEAGGRWLQALSGAVMCGLAALLLFAPDWLA